MITDLPTKCIQVLSQWQTFLRVFVYKMAAKINGKNYATVTVTQVSLIDQRDGIVV